ncbi:MAG: hypothetical protein Q8914_13450 [Bacteroidota bacterium]|nr:hypothetical protein [Bacteroidota bacterium]
MFSFNRFSQQFKIILYQNAHRHSIYLLIFAIYMLFKNFRYAESFSFLNGFSGITGNLSVSFESFCFIVTLIAIIHSVEVFGQLRSTSSGISYLMLPATIFEKYAAAWIYTTIVTFLVYLSTYYLIHIVTISAFNLFSSSGIAYSLPTLSQLWDSMKDLFFFQSLFFLGAVVFRKNPVGKTIVSILICMVVLSIIYIVFLHHMATEQAAYWNSSMNLSFNMNNLPGNEAIKEILRICSWLLPFACWTGAYYKLKSLQI